MAGVVETKIDIGKLNEAKAAALLTFRGPVLAAANKQGANAAVAETTDYYSRGGASIFTRPGPTHGEGRKKTNWWMQVAEGWTVAKTSATGATLSNSTVGLAHHVEGGTIKPKKAASLTIPLIPEAHGRTAKEYSLRFSKLFRVGGVLAEKDDSEKGFRAVFALKKSVSMSPTKGALPPDEKISDAFLNAAIDHLIAHLEK